MSTSTRRSFLQTVVGTTAAASLAGLASPVMPGLISDARAEEGKPWFKISLAQWSLHRALRKGAREPVDPLDFAKIARQFGINGIEYVNQFYVGKATDQAYLNQMKKAAEDQGVTSVLIMCDQEGKLGDPNEAARKKAVENHHKWVDAAKFLGCHSIRVNAASAGSWDEQVKLAADGLAQLAAYGDSQGINVIVENHGGLSSNGKWLAQVMKTVNHPRMGTLPDFGNFRLNDKEWYDRYQGVAELMPFAKGVSAKSHEFDAQGNEVRTDYARMLKIVRDAGYRGWIGVEYEGDQVSELEGIRLTKALLDRLNVA